MTRKELKTIPKSHEKPQFVTTVGAALSCFIYQQLGLDFCSCLDALIINNKTVTEALLSTKDFSGDESSHRRRKSGQRACVQKSSGDDVIDVCQGVGCVEVDDEVGGVGEVQASAAAWRHRRYVNGAGTLA